MFKEDKCCTSLKYWRLYTPEEELYTRLKENPFWPFKQLSDGYFQVVYRSDRVTYGLGILIAAIIPFVVILVLLDYFELLLGFFITFFFFGCWALYGQVGWRELVISTRGRGKYMVRMFQNQEILFKNDIRNVYIRLAQKIDSQNDPHFFLVIGGFGMDDIRMTRMTRAEGPMKIMGMRIAYRLGINFFDWKNESEEHLVWHYRTFSKKIIKSKKEKKDGTATPSAGGSLPDIRITTRHHPPGQSLKAHPKALRSSIAPEDASLVDPSSKRKVRINKEVDVRRLSRKIQ